MTIRMEEDLPVMKHRPVSSGIRQDEIGGDKLGTVDPAASISEYSNCSRYGREQSNNSTRCVRNYLHGSKAIDSCRDFYLVRA
jgi:hypothetical protein